MRSKSGWFNIRRDDPFRHAQAARGIKTGRKAYEKKGRMIGAASNGMFYPTDKAVESQMRRDINLAKKRLIAQAKKTGIVENFGQDEVRKLRDKYSDYLYKPESELISQFDEWAMTFDDTKLKKLSYPKDDFARDAAGKISTTVLSEYGKAQLKTLQGTKLYFSDVGTVTVKGNKLIINKTGKTLTKIDSDRIVNKIEFRLLLSYPKGKKDSKVDKETKEIADDLVKLTGLKYKVEHKIPTKRRLIGHSQTGDTYETPEGELWLYTGTKPKDYRNPKHWMALTYPKESDFKKNARFERERKKLFDDTSLSNEEYSRKVKQLAKKIYGTEKINYTAQFKASDIGAVSTDLVTGTAVAVRRQAPLIGTAIALRKARQILKGKKKPKKRKKKLNYPSAIKSKYPHVTKELTKLSKKHGVKKPKLYSGKHDRLATYYPDEKAIKLSKRLAKLPKSKKRDVAQHEFKHHMDIVTTNIRDVPVLEERASKFERRTL